MPDRLPDALRQALADAEPLAVQRGWQRPTEATLAEAARLLALVTVWPAPQVTLDPEGGVLLEWEAGERGWLQLCVRGTGELTHSAVIAGDDYAQSEPFDQVLPDWAAELLGRLWDPPRAQRVHH